MGRGRFIGKVVGLGAVVTPAIWAKWQRRPADQLKYVEKKLAGLRTQATYIYVHAQQPAQAAQAEQWRLHLASVAQGLPLLAALSKARRKQELAKLNIQLAALEAEITQMFAQLEDNVCPAADNWSNAETIVDVEIEEDIDE